MTYYDNTFDFLLAIGAVFIVILVIAVVISIISYIIRGLGLYKIAKRRYHPNPWMAWVPYANMYLYAELIDRDLVVGKRTIRNFPVWYVVYPFIVVFATVILQVIAIFPFIGWVIGGLGGLACSVASTTIFIYIRYRFYKKYRLDQATLYTVLSALLPLAEPFILFIISRRPFVGEAEGGVQQPAPTVYPPTY